jgi:hypothetical protein
MIYRVLERDGTECFATDCIFAALAALKSGDRRAVWQGTVKIATGHPHPYATLWKVAA